MLSRQLEPEVMDSPEEARDYDSMDHSAVNAVFVDDLLRAVGSWSSAAPLRILDVGTGTAQIPLELCGRGRPVRITAIDAAANMLQLALRNVVKAGCQAQIKLEQLDAKQLPHADGEFDAVMSNSIVHHIPEPLAVLSEMVRVVRPGGWLFVRDLMRPPDLETLHRLVATHAAGANDHQRKMFGDSLHAALTVEEVRGLLRQIGVSVECVRETSDRHWTIACRMASREH